MNKKMIFKGTMGLLWLIICIVVCFKIFLNIRGAELYFDSKLNLKTNPYFGGGKAITTLEEDNYTVTIHEPLYQGYPFRKRHGYMQIEWFWDSEEPKLLSGSYDLDSDGINDIYLQLKTSDTYVTWKSYNDGVLGPMVNNSTLTYMRVGKEDDLTVLKLDNKRIVKIMIKKGFADRFYNKDIYKR